MVGSWKTTICGLLEFQEMNVSSWLRAIFYHRMIHHDSTSMIMMGLFDFMMGNVDLSTKNLLTRALIIIFSVMINGSL